MGDQVRLVDIGPEHAPAMLGWMRDPVVAEGIGLSRTPSRDATLGWIGRAQADADVAAWAVLAGGTHVGNVVLDQIDRHLGTARFSIYLGEPDARGRGVGRQATLLAVDRGFAHLGLHKVWLNVHSGNVRAIQAYAAVGFLVEGVLRGEFLLGDRRMDVLRMAVLSDEWSR